MLVVKFAIGALLVFIITILTDETFGWREVVGSTMIVVGGVLAVVLAPKEEK